MSTTHLQVSCASSSIVSRNVIIAYGSIYGILLVIISIYSFKSLNKDTEFVQKSLFKKFKAWILDLKKRKSCYIPIITHLFDQLTDISVAIQFYEIATDETKYKNDWEACNGLNIWYLFMLSVLALTIYRAITAYLIYKYTNKSCTRCVSQILDIELLRALYINYLCDKTTPCDPQRWITAMEATLESTPQSLIQLIYLVKTDTFNPNNILIIISLSSSLWTIISRLVADDKVIVCKQAQNLNFRFQWHVLVDIMIGLVTLVLIMISSVIFYLLFMTNCFIYFIPYLIFRGTTNIFAYHGQYSTGRLEILHPDSTKKDKKSMRIGTQKGSIVWISGEFDNTDPQIEKRRVEKRFMVNIDKDYKEWTILYNDYDKYLNGSKYIMNIDNIVNIFFVDQFKCPRSFSWLYMFRIVWRICDVTSRLFGMILTWLIVGGFYLSIIIIFEFAVILLICMATKHWELIIGIVASVISLTEETQTISAVICIYRIISNYFLMMIISIFLFGKFDCYKCTDYIDRESFSTSSNTFGIFLYCCISTVLSSSLLILLFAYRIFVEGATTSRALEQMIDAENWDGVLELQLYAEQYGVYDEREVLILLAMREHREAIVLYLLKKKDRNILPTNWLLSVMSNPELLTSKNLHETITLFPFILDEKTEYSLNVLDIYSESPKKFSPQCLQKIYEQRPQLTTQAGQNAATLLLLSVQHYANDSTLLSTSDLFYIQEKHPDFFNQVFVSAVFANNAQYFSKLFLSISATQIEKLADSSWLQLLENYDENPALVSSIELIRVIKNKTILLEKLLEYYAYNPILLKTKDLLFIEQEQTELKDALIVSAVIADNQEYVKEIISKKKAQGLKPSSLNTLLNHYANNRSVLTPADLTYIYHLL